MLRLTFWNLHRSLRAAQLLTELAVDREIDILVTAEEPEGNQLRTSLQAMCNTPFRVHTGRVNRRVTIYTRETVQISEPVGESRYIVVHRLIVPDRPPALLAAMHGISRLEDELSDLNEEATVASELLREVEDREKHRRTILVGDFNLNPFDEGMFKARGFFGVMTRADAARQSRQVKWNRYPIFYNPMWSRLGDLSPGPPGTFYRERANHFPHFWHMYDQVLLRHALAECFDQGTFEIVTEVRNRSLLIDGIPDAQNYSDHLPVVVGLDLDRLQ